MANMKVLECANSQEPHQRCDSNTYPQTILDKAIIWFQRTKVHSFIPLDDLQNKA